MELFTAVHRYLAYTCGIVFLCLLSESRRGSSRYGAPRRPASHSRRQATAACSMEAFLSMSFSQPPTDEPPIVFEVIQRATAPSSPPLQVEVFDRGNPTMPESGDEDDDSDDEEREHENIDDEEIQRVLIEFDSASFAEPTAGGILPWVAVVPCTASTSAVAVAAAVAIEVAVEAAVAGAESVEAAVASEVAVEVAVKAAVAVEVAVEVAAGATSTGETCSSRM